MWLIAALILTYLVAARCSTVAQHGRQVIEIVAARSGSSLCSTVQHGHRKSLKSLLHGCSTVMALKSPHTPLARDTHAHTRGRGAAIRAWLGSNQEARLMKIMLPEIAPAGFVIVLDGQGYTSTGFVAYRNRSGEIVPMNGWASTCFECGRPIDCMTAPGKPLEPKRRCTEHAQPGKRVTSKSHRPA